MSMNFNRDPQAGSDALLDLNVLLARRGASNDGSEDTPVTTTLRAALTLIKAAMLAAGATQHYVATVAAGDVEIEWDLLNLDNLSPALRQRIAPAPTDGSPGDIVTVAGGGTSFTLTAAPTPPNVTTTVNGLMLAADKVKLNALDTVRQVARGGSARQVYTKQGPNDGDAAWETPVAGGGSTTLSGTIVSAVDDATAAEVILPEPSAAATWGAWTVLSTYTASAAGRHLVTAQAHGMAEKTADGTTWVDMVALGGGDRISAELRLLHQGTTDLGEVFNYVRNLPTNNLADTHEVFDLIATQYTLASGDTLTLQARYQQQLVGAQGDVGDANRRTAGRLRFPAGDVIMRVTNFGEIASANTPPPAHQVYILVRDTPAVPTIAEFKAGISSTSGSAVITGNYANTKDLRYINMWSEDQIGYISLSNVGLNPGENQLADFTEGRLLDGATNGYTYTNYDLYERALRTNPTISWRAQA